jgi:hypothetical protein
MLLAIGGVLILYVTVALAVFGNLDVQQVIEAKDYALAEAARPVFGLVGFSIVAIAALVSTASSINANLYAVTNATYQLARKGNCPQHSASRWVDPARAFSSARDSSSFWNMLSIYLRDCGRGPPGDANCASHGVFRAFASTARNRRFPDSGGDGGHFRAYRTCICVSPCAPGIARTLFWFGIKMLRFGHVPRREYW